MALRRTDPESYITKHTFIYEELLTLHRVPEDENGVAALEQKGECLST